MCIAPIILANGMSAACHKCWQCRERAVDDWVGRNIAEVKVSKWARAVTLTYGRADDGTPDHERAVILTYSDVQKWLKLLRRHGYPVRYFITGEFGSEKGRAHWHVMLYGSGAMPPHELEDKYFVGADWHHGFSFWTRPEHRNVRYNCKYIQKDIGEDNRQGHLAMSKKPPLGAVYFERMAEQYVRAELAPQTLFYSFPEVRRRKADGTEEVVQFMLWGRSAELFLEHYVSVWRATYGARPFPVSELVDAWVYYGRTAVLPEDNAMRMEFLERFHDWEWRRKLPDVPKPALRDLYSWMRMRELRWNRNKRAWEVPTSRGLYEWRWMARKGSYGWRKIADGSSSQF